MCGGRCTVIVCIPRAKLISRRLASKVCTVLYQLNLYILNGVFVSDK